MTTGENKYFVATRVPLRNKKHQIIGIVGTSIDITAQKESERLKLNQLDLECEISKAEIERLRLENKLQGFENEAYLAEKKSQERVTQFIDKMLHEIQIFRIEELHDKIGIKPQITNIKKQIELTKREQQVIYFLSLNKSPKDMCAVAKLH